MYEYIVTTNWGTEKSVIGAMALPDTNGHLYICGHMGDDVKACFAAGHWSCVVRMGIPPVE